MVAATPLGNPADASGRLRDLLATADVIAAEDTRRIRRLASDLQVHISGRVVSFHDNAERTRVPGLVAAMQEGATVLVVSDAGMPGVSDPGYRIIRAAIDVGLPVTVAPGPSAVLTALVLSGLPVDRFCFEGFLPRKAGERRSRIAELGTEPRTLVFFEAPHRIAETLRDLAEAWGAREAAICRELTKTYEEVIRGDLVVLAHSVGELRGEITLVVAGRTAPLIDPSDPAALAVEVEVRVAAGVDRRQAVSAVAQDAGVPRRVVYDAVVAAKRPH